MTIHHCFFESTRQRHPHPRFSKIYISNDYTKDWGIYAICASVEAQLTHIGVLFHMLATHTL